MDWINEKFEKLFSWVRNLTFRRAMIAYILLTSVIVWALSFVTMRLVLAVGEQPVETI